MSKFISFVSLEDHQPVTININQIVKINPLYETEFKSKLNATTICVGMSNVSINIDLPYKDVVASIRLESIKQR